MLVRSSLTALDRSFDRTFDQLTAGLIPGRLGARRPLPEVRAHHDAVGHDDLVLTVDLPGIAAEAVSVEVAGRSLTIGVDSDDLRWSRSLQLGPALDPDKVSAHHLNGRLTVQIGSVDAPETRSITIETSPVTSLDPAQPDRSTDIATSVVAEDQSTATSSGSDHPGA
jgi:HSP20 family molecular chaperone IbpA